MKYFYGSLTGSGKLDRTVSATMDSSIQAHIRTFNTGVFVSMYHSNGMDTWLIYKTDGTFGERGGKKMTLIKQIEVPSP